MRQLVDGVRAGRLPKRAVAVTFDDGYADNLQEALPILEKRGVPTTFFVASGFVGGREEAFPDELDRLLLQPSKAAGMLRVGAWSMDLPAMSAVTAGNWNVLEKVAPTARHEAYRQLCALAGPMDHAGRQGLLDEVRTWAGAGREGRESHRMMSENELARLASSPLATIGAHTVTHPRLSAIGLEEQGREIRQSKRRLEEIMGREVASFAYPYGGDSDYSAETVRAVKEAGFEFACSNYGGVVRHGADLLQINRVLARDWPADVLEEKIEGWFLE